jgi:hypothetical protein
MRGIGLILLTLLVISAAGDVREPDFWTELDNDYYAAGLEQYDDYIGVYDVALRGAARLDADDPALGYVFPLALGPVEAGSRVEIPLPPVPDFDPERDYDAHIYFGVSGDGWVASDVAYTVTHRVPGGVYESYAVEGHCWSAPVTSGQMSGGLHSVVILTGGFFAETEGVETTGVSELYLVVGILASDAPDFAEMASNLREENPEGTSVVFANP